MLTNKNIVCPENLLNIAKGKGPVKAVIVNAGPFSLAIFKRFSGQTMFLFDNIKVFHFSKYF